MQLAPLSICRTFSSSPAAYFNINHIKSHLPIFWFEAKNFSLRVVPWLEFPLAIFFALITPIMSSLGFPVSISLKWNKNWKTFGKEHEIRILLDPHPPPPSILLSPSCVSWKQILNYLTSIHLPHALSLVFMETIHSFFIGILSVFIKFKLWDFKDLGSNVIDSRKVSIWTVGAFRELSAYCAHFTWKVSLMKWSGKLDIILHLK